MYDNIERMQVIQMEDLKNRKEAYTALFNALGPEHYATLEAEYYYAMALSVDGKNEDSLSHLESAYQGFQKYVDIAYYNDILYKCTYDYALSLYHNDEAEKALIPLLDVISDTLDTNLEDDIIIDCHFLLVDCLEACGEIQKAQDAIMLVYDTLMDTHEPGEYNVIQAVIRYAMLLDKSGKKKKALSLLSKHRKMCEYWDDTVGQMLTTIYRAYLSKGTPTYDKEMAKARKLIQNLGQEFEDFPAEGFQKMLEIIESGLEPNLE